MTEQRRAGAPLVVLALGLALLAALVLVVPGSSAVPSNVTYEGTGSATVSLSGPATGHSAVAHGHHAGAGSEQSGAGDSSHTSTDPDGQRHFYISVGSLSGLYPGKRARLPVVFHNPLPTPIRVLSATTRATGPAGCDLATSLVLRTRVFIHRVIVPARGNKAKTLRFGMRKTATDACQGAVFTIYVSAAGVPA